MQNYRKSDYAINKNSPNIVYRFHNEIIEITLEDYLKENPDKTEHDFAELKALSDQIYYEQDRAESAQTRKDVSIHGLEETEHCATRALDSCFSGTLYPADRSHGRDKPSSRCQVHKPGDCQT